MTQSISKYSQKVKSIAQKYRERGFNVEVEPSEEFLKRLPFDLVQYSYTPDLIAIKDDEGSVVEIKHKNKHISVSKLQNISDTISHCENWHFLIATIDNLETEDELEQEVYLSSSTSLPSWEIISEQQLKVSSLIKTGDLEPALLYQVSIFEAILRKRASFLSLPVQNLSGTSLLNHLYSLGEISVIQIDICQKYLKLRNQIAHGFMQVIDPSELGEFCELVQILIQDWSAEATAV